VRLNAYLARAGVASRRKADELIKAVRVTVNGEPGRGPMRVGLPVADVSAEHREDGRIATGSEAEFQPSTAEDV